MQIEEIFRDTKFHRWGFGLHDARPNDGRRLAVLLLIATLASLKLANPAHIRLARFRAPMAQRERLPDTLDQGVLTAKRRRNR
jgi:hypothetical protein